MAHPRSQPNAHHHREQISDALYCEEEQFDEVEGGVDSHYSASGDSSITQTPILTDGDLLWEEDELRSLLSKEVQNNGLYDTLDSNSSLVRARREGVDWMLKVSSHYNFSAFTAVLAVNCLDRFLFHFQCQREKLWMTQLAAVACLSIAAKVEETQVPLLLDLQVEDARFVFEAKTIQRMEILVLSTLQWKMNPVTPLSFLDYIARRIGLKGSLCFEFFRKSESLLLSTLYDSRFMCYLPSVLAMSIMLHAMDGLVPLCSIRVESLNQLLNGIDKGKVGECCRMIRERANSNPCSNKRKMGRSVPSSPSGVIDASFSCDSSNDSWTATMASTSSISSLPEPPPKRSRVQELPPSLAQLLTIPR